MFTIFVVSIVLYFITTTFSSSISRSWQTERRELYIGSYSPLFSFLRTEIINSLRYSLNCSAELSLILRDSFFDDKNSCGNPMCSVFFLVLLNALRIGKPFQIKSRTDHQTKLIVVVLLNFNAGRQWREKSIRDSSL